MTEQIIFDDLDKALMKKCGLSPKKAAGELSIFKKGPGFLDLARPATPGDGILVFSDEKTEEYARFYDEKPSEIKPVKFIPASGAATRMWKALMVWRSSIEKEGLAVLRLKAREGDREALSVIAFFENLPKFAFYEALSNECKIAGKNIEELLDFGNYGPLLRIILDTPGLGYGHKAKGLILFHNYTEGPRTPFEEHLVEAASYARDSEGVCRLHFTVPENQFEDFQNLFKSVRAGYENKLGVKFEVNFSVQDKSTDTIAAKEDFTPFRTAKGELLFRPAGHGALLKNLDTINFSPIFLANIDNVVTDALLPSRFLWKKALAGLLLELKEKIFNTLENLEKNKESLFEALAFAEQKLFIRPPENMAKDRLADYLCALLKRPIRVCGMVKNLGDPGGAPFWVKGPDGRLSLQIVEQAQVRHDMPKQADIFRSSTHFNPVDVVAWVFDWRGKKLTLSNFVDEHAVFISKKSLDGKNLFALEIPGLWNGAMSEWTTVFVDVPMSAYNPVKSVNDLLNPSHVVV